MLRWLRSRLCAFCFVFAVYIFTVLFAISIIVDSGNSSQNKAIAKSKIPSSTRVRQVDIDSHVSARRNKLVWCKKLHYRSEPGPVVALASFPGSGNTWIRYLLQQATGAQSSLHPTVRHNHAVFLIVNHLCLSNLTHNLSEAKISELCRLRLLAGFHFLTSSKCSLTTIIFPLVTPHLIQRHNSFPTTFPSSGIYTGSVYKDYGLLKNGFPAESVVNGSVSVVKTHEWGPYARQLFDKAILLVRRPGPAIQAEFNRQSGGHIGFASPDRYLRNRGRYWHQFVTEKLSSWKHMNLDWLHNFSGPVHIVFYEQLIKDLEVQLCNILNFLDLTFTENDLQCAIERREGIYRRRKGVNIVTFDPFTEPMKAAIEKEQREVYNAISKLEHRKTIYYNCLNNIKISN